MLLLFNVAPIARACLGEGGRHAGSLLRNGEGGVAQLGRGTTVAGQAAQLLDSFRHRFRVPCRERNGHTLPSNLQFSIQGPTILILEAALKVGQAAQLLDGFR